MAEAGFDEAAIEANLDQIWVWRELHLAETDDQAMDEFLPAQHDAWANMQYYRTNWNPPQYNMDRQPPPMQKEGYGPRPDPEGGEIIVGSPGRVAEHLAQMRDAGIRNLMLTNRGLVSAEKTGRSLKLLSEKVMPYFR